MKNRKIGSCTTILVGKNASLDGSTLIARNEDSGGDTANPQTFKVISPENQPKNYQAVQSTVNFDLPDNPMRYTSTPDADTSNGIWGESGINEANVAMTATETITTNSRILGLDPLVDDGLGEEDFLTVVLPYIKSAKEGVLRLGSLIEKYGTYESNGIAFSDIDDVWYFETLGGHHWAAVRIPDDAYVVAPNRLNIDHFEFDAADYLYAPDLPEFISENNLNPDENEINLRHIFGSATIKDTRYNNPRAWYGHQYFNKGLNENPEDQDLPFIMKPDRKISIEDIKFVLSSHFENTQYDAYGNGSESDKKRFRPIGINRNQELHILQIRPNVAPEIAGIHWLAMGPNTFNALVPFFANINDTPAQYRDTKTSFDFNNVYWLSRATAVLGDTNYDAYSSFSDTLNQNVVSFSRQIMHETDKSYQAQANLSEYLEIQNKKMADYYFAQATKLFGEMVELGASKMKLRFNLAD